MYESNDVTGLSLAEFWWQCRGVRGAAGRPRYGHRRELSLRSLALASAGV